MVSVIRNLSRKGLVHEPLWLYVRGKSGYGDHLNVSYIQQFGYKKDSKSSNVRPSGDGKFERCMEDKKSQKSQRSQKPQKQQKSKKDECVLTKLPSDDIKLNVAVKVNLRMNVRLDEYDFGTDLCEPKNDKQKKEDICRPPKLDDMKRSSKNLKC